MGDILHHQYGETSNYCTGTQFVVVCLAIKDRRLFVATGLVCRRMPCAYNATQQELTISIIHVISLYKQYNYLVSEFYNLTAYVHRKFFGN